MTRKEAELLNEIGRRYGKLTNGKERKEMLTRARSMPTSEEAIRYAYGKYTGRKLRNNIRKYYELVGKSAGKSVVGQSLELFRTDPQDALALIDRAYKEAIENQLSALE